MPQNVSGAGVGAAARLPPERPAGGLPAAVPGRAGAGPAVLADSHPGIGLTKVLTTVSWLIACGAVVFLWQRPSSAFFRAAGASGRPA
jgi:hypothetical protein